MNFRSNTLHIRYTFPEPPEEIPLVETLVEVVNRVPTDPPVTKPVYPKTKAEYPPEIPPEIDPVDLPLIVELPKESVKWLQQPQEPVEKTIPAPVSRLLKRTRNLYRIATAGCLQQQGWGVVCMRRYGKRILAIRKTLIRPKQKIVPPVIPSLLTPVRRFRMPVRKTVMKPKLPHSAPTGIGCADFDGYSFDIQWEGDNIGNVQLVVKLNGTQIFDTGLVGNNARSLTLKTNAGIPAPFGIHNGLFAESLFTNSGNTITLEFTGFSGLNAIQAVDEFGWMKDGAFWSATATSNQLVDFSNTPPVIAPPQLGAYPLTFNIGMVGVC